MAQKRYDSTRQWYAVHTYSGYEDKVADSIRQRINAVDMADKIFAVMVPKEKQIEIKNGKRKIVDRKIFQGYCLVDLRSGQRTCFNSIQAPLKYPIFFFLPFLVDFLFSFLEICASLGATLTDFLSVFCFLGTTVSPDSTTLVVTLAAFFFFAFATLFSQLNNLLVSRLSILIVTNDSIFCKLAVSLKF